MTAPDKHPIQLAAPAADSAMRASPEVVVKAAEHIRGLLGGDSSGHDWWHVWRVWQNARWLAAQEGADPLVCELAALLHDIADWKFHGGDETAGPRAARKWLVENCVAPAILEHVCEIVATVTFKGAGVPTPTRTLEAAVVQDADRLDALGAIGVARAFAYGGATGRILFDPETPPVSHETFGAYQRNSGPTLNHFYEKLLLLKDRMQTAAGRRLAAERHAFLELFLRQFLAEWSHSGSL